MEEQSDTGHVRHRSPTDSSLNKRLSKYGAAFEPPKDDAVFYPHDDTHSFFERGRDFESAYVNHKYTKQERATLGTFESLDYLPSHSLVYKHWIKRQPSRLDWDRWLMMGLIGLVVGLIGFLLHQIIDVIANTKWEQAQLYIETQSLLVAWGWVLGYSVLFVAVSAALVVFVRPSAGGSGIPELIGFLNGTVVRHIFNVKTMVVKFLSCCCSVGSGMPVGPEGPMIHLGSLVGAGLSQFKSDTLRLRLPFFERFRNPEDRRNFVSAGAAAGVASAFGAPVGGLLFSMEEVSSFWNMKLSWQIFFCAMVSTFTTDLFNSAFDAFVYQGDFGLFKAEKYILFQVKNGIAVNILAFIPSVILGVIGGILGALFNFMNLKIARARKRILAGVTEKWKQRAIRMTEPVVIMIIVATISVFLPAAFPCSPYTCIHDKDGQVRGDKTLATSVVQGSGFTHADRWTWCMPYTSPHNFIMQSMTVDFVICPNCLVDTQNPLHIEPTVARYTCPKGIKIQYSNYTWTNDTFNQMATLLFGTGEKAIRHLFSRTTHLEFDYGPLFTVLPYYFIMACWSAGTSISSGLVVPMLFIGGLYGRIVGLVMVSCFGVHTEEDSYWAWIDPGAFALVGAASFFGGVSRLTMSLTVIMMEITNDVQFLLPIMAAIMVAKWVGDFVTHPLYHALLELKCIPFLDAEPVIAHGTKRMVNLELFTAHDIMTPKPVTLTLHESVSHLSELLLDTSHGGFPVVNTAANGEVVFYGFITRLELTVLLRNEDMFDTDTAEVEELDVAPVEYQSLTLDKLSNPQVTQDMLQSYCDDPKYMELYINLKPYINQSAVTVQEKFSLHRTYIIFRTLGLRHLTVVDDQNHVVGIVTRKDLMGFHMEEKLESIMHQTMLREGRVVELPETDGLNTHA